MAEKRTTPDAPKGVQEGAQSDAPADARRKKRMAPTIDLTATEMPQTSAPEPPPAEPESAPDVEIHPPASDRAGATVIAATIAAGLAGGAIVLLVLLGLWFAGLVPVRYAATSGTNAQAAAETRILDALAQRVGNIEAALAKLPASDPAIADKVAAADNAMKSLGIALTALNRRSDDIAANAAQARERADAAAKAVAALQSSLTAAASSGPSSAELDALEKRIAALESAVRSARAEIGTVAGKSSSNDHDARLALSASVLRDAVLAGAPFADELAAVKQLGGGDTSLAALAPFAATGVPSPATLAHELHALIPGMLKISGTGAPNAGFLERLQANAGKLVRISPMNAPAGNDPSAVLGRIEIDAADNDVAAALADLGQLPDAVRAPANAWIEKAKARQAAVGAARQIAADTAHNLAPR
jgi:hypothetical protein